MYNLKQFFAYKGLEDDGWFEPPITYQELVASMGLDAVIFLDEHDYQGDSIALLHSGYRSYGILSFSWGSCSGCDALKSCRSFVELEQLREQLYNKIHWQIDKGGTPGELAHWWINREHDFYETLHDTLNKSFTEMLKNYMNFRYIESEYDAYKIDLD